MRRAHSANRSRRQIDVLVPALSATLAIMFEIKFTDSAKDDMRYFTSAAQTGILDEIEKQLRYEPTIETRNRKELRQTDIATQEQQRVHGISGSAFIGARHNFNRRIEKRPWHQLKP